MMFFKFSDNSNPKPKYLWARNAIAFDGAGDVIMHRWKDNRHLPIEEWPTLTYFAQFETVDYVGSKKTRRTVWPDVLGVDSQLAISTRVHEALRELEIQRFRVDPVVPDPEDSGLPPGVEAPVYHLVTAAPGIRLDLNACGVDPDDKMTYVGRRSDTPVVDTWAGYDLFGYELGGLYCTLRIVELARKHKWTNCRFMPMDAQKKYTMGWPGVDYLGKKWPPERWYPPRPSDGKMLQGWIDELLHAPTLDHTGLAMRALRDLGEAAASPLSELFLKSSDAETRLRIAFVLDGLQKDKVPVDPKAGAEATQIIEDRKARARRASIEGS